MSTLAVDFDGVLHDDSRRGTDPSVNQLGPPLEGAKNAICYLRNEKNHKIIIYSVKPPDIIEDWLRYFDIPFDRITTQKPVADIYIDDKALHFRNWPDAFVQLAYRGIDV